MGDSLCIELECESERESPLKMIFFFKIKKKNCGEFGGLILNTKFFPCELEGIHA